MTDLKNVCTIALITFCALLQACVSVSLGSKPPLKSESAGYVEPTQPFKEVESRHLDKTWRNTKNGNTISYLSDCYSAIDPTLENILSGILSEVEHTNVIESHTVEYNLREALHSTVSGQVDGIKTLFELMIFKKNNCTYILTYAAKDVAFGENQKEFLTFIKGFKVQ